ncbi:LysR family transcriptional regulator [Neorhizobium lilium]|uniref:LysR family transcriptional regulator n=1 Tax=Neorhizobium lilium TaxID=2503024 RepID=UPI001981AC93|nr:LysR family transcriptional regulator [Neorhizobium lilium]
MPEPGTPTFDQLRVLVTVVEAGSFAGAARKLNRATSVISYTIANLEAQLGVRLFDRETTRKPQLTDAGRMVLAEARLVANGVDSLRAKTRGLLQGIESELHIVLDTFLPEHRVIDALTGFFEAFPTVALHLAVETLGMVTQLVLDRRAMIGVSGPYCMMDGIEIVSIGSVRLIPAAAPVHPLALADANMPGAGRGHIQLVLTDRSQLTAGREVAVLSSKTWRLADLASKHMLMKAGIGWGYMPEPFIRDDIDDGRLIALNMPDAPPGDYSLHAIHRTDTPPGPAAVWLIERLRAQAGPGAAKASANDAPTIMG